MCWCARLSTEAQFVYSGIVGVCVGVHVCRQRHSLCIIVL